MGDPTLLEETDESRGGRLRRRAREARREAPSAPPVPAPASPDPTPAPAHTHEERAGDLWSASTATARRVEELIAALAALRADMGKDVTDIAVALTRGQERTTREVNDTLARSLESTRSELVARFQGDLEGLTNTMSDALTQVATHLEQVSILCSENRDSAEAVAEQLQAISGRLDTRAEPPPPDLQPLSEAFARLADRVEALARRVG